MLSNTDFCDLLHLAEAAASQAGRMLHENRATWSTPEFESRRDVKVRGDREAEQVLATLLTNGSAFPVFGEESGLIGEPDEAYTWVVDPLDGTANYKAGVPLCCVSVALVQRGEPVLGAIFDFNANEMFSGFGPPDAPGSCARFNGQPMRVSTTDAPQSGILATGFPAASDLGDASIGEYVASVQAFRKVRSLGSAALMLAYVACGRFDAYWEKNVRFWDVAAGVALVRAAGGRVADRSASREFSRQLDLRAWNGRFDFA